MKRTAIRNSFLVAGLAGGIAVSASGQVLVNETFDYADTAALLENWAGGAATLNAGDGQPSPSASHPGGTVNSWQTAFSIRPTSESQIILSADFYDPGGALARQSIGLRNGADPLLELGSNNGNFGNYAIRVLGFGGNDNWSYFDTDATSEVNIREVGWHNYHAVITESEVTVTLTLQSGAQHTLVSSGAFSANNFTDLRIGGPSNLSSPIAWSYDNIHLELAPIPEPSTYAAIFGGLALVGAFVYRRRLSAKK